MGAFVVSSCLFHFSPTGTVHNVPLHWLWNWSAPARALSNCSRWRHSNGILLVSNHLHWIPLILCLVFDHSSGLFLTWEEQQQLCSEGLPDAWALCSVGFAAQLSLPPQQRELHCSTWQSLFPLLMTKTQQMSTPFIRGSKSPYKNGGFCLFSVQMKTSASCTALQKTLTSSLPCPARLKMARPALVAKEMSA